MDLDLRKLQCSTAAAEHRHFVTAAATASPCGLPADASGTGSALIPAASG